MRTTGQVMIMPADTMTKDNTKSDSIIIVSPEVYDKIVEESKSPPKPSARLMQFAREYFQGKRQH